MANNLSRYFQNQVLNWFKGTSVVTPTATTASYIGLYTTMPTDNNGTGAVEVSGNGYARQALTNATWGTIGTSGSLQQMSYGAALTFPADTTANWGSILGSAIFDAVTVGNLLFFGLLAAPVTINVGNQFAFLLGQVVLQVD